jgi:hypothetical protein
MCGMAWRRLRPVVLLLKPFERAASVALLKLSGAVPKGNGFDPKEYPVVTSSEFQKLPAGL